MDEYRFLTAANVKNALELLDALGAEGRIVNGGTDTMVRIHLGRCPICTFVNIRDLDELKYIRQEGEEIVIGAGTTIHTLSQSQLLLEKAPALFLAANVFADPTTRHSATIGGNIGNASPSADTAPSLLVFDATIVIESLKGKRTVPATAFFTGVGRTVVQPGEMVTEIRFHANPNSAFYKLGLRGAMAISLVNIAVAVDLDKKGIMKDVRIALGAVAPTPVRAAHAEAILRGSRPEKELIKQAMEALQEDIHPITDVRASAEYRRLVSSNLMRRVLRKACGICENEEEDRR